MLLRIARLLVAICGIGLTLSVCSGAAGAATTGPPLTALHYGGSFVPLQLIASAGRVWVVGSNDLGSFTRCQLQEITPSSMATSFFALPACPTDIAAIDGKVDMVAAAPEASGSTHEMHLEVFDPATGQARLLAPVVMGIPGSGIAHTNFAAGDGLLWLYGYQASVTAGSEEVVGISPQTGSVEVTIVDPPEIGGILPALAGNAAGRWFGGGPGARLAWSGLRRPARRRSCTRGPPAAPSSGCRLWGASVWAGVDDGRLGRPTWWRSTGGAVSCWSTHHELIGDYPLVPAAGRLWSMAWAGSCGDPAELVELDAGTGASRPRRGAAGPAGRVQRRGHRITGGGGRARRLRAHPTGSSGSGRALPGCGLSAGRPGERRQAARRRRRRSTSASTWRALMKPRVTAWRTKPRRPSKKPSTLRMPHGLSWMPSWAQVTDSMNSS